MSTHDPSDPSDARRTERVYEFPIPSRESVLAHLAARGEPLSLARLSEELGLTSEREREAFARRLRAMERDGQLVSNRRGRYGLADRMEMVCGRIIGHPDGFGFLEPEDGGVDLFLSPREMRQVMNGDRVLARPGQVDARGRREATIVEVLERRHAHVVGRFLDENHMSFLLPSDRRLSQNIAIARGQEAGARNGQIVVAEILEQPTRRTPAVGRIVEVLGDHLAPGMEIEIAIRMHELPRDWPPAVSDEVAGLAPEVPESAKKGRTDLRAVPLITIDGADARDFDDAVYCERRGKGFRLLVAIADVSHYVRPDTALDREAYQRGNSVYFPGFVIPMLPEILSNGLCSLNPRVDRLALVCEMDIGPRGAIERHRFLEAVIRSHARLTYGEAARMLADPGSATAPHAALQPQLDDLHALYRVLHAARLRRGAIDFELPETRIVFDAGRKIERIEQVERNDAHRLIEECMLAANVCAAEFLTTHGVAVPYRIHAGPTPDKLSELRNFLGGLGLQLGGGEEPSASDYAKLLGALDGRKDARTIQMVMLRSLSQAIYSPDNIGHFALGFPNYTHFTSPIRRYPDLQVHRSIRALLRGAAGGEVPGHSASEGAHLSMTERRADDASRDVNRWLKAEYLLDKIGQEFDGVITGVANFGLFIELSEVYVDGLVHISALGNDYYQFDPARHRLIGDRTRRIYRLGDPVRVRVMQVALDEAKVDLELVAAPDSAERPERPRSGPRRGPRQRKARRKSRR